MERLELSYPEKRWGEDLTTMRLYLTEDGLCFERIDSGPRVQANHPWSSDDDDVESYVSIEKQHLTRMLMELIREHFESQGSFRLWLEKKGVPYSTYVH